MKREIELVKPKYIVSFGLIPLRYLIKEKIKLSDYYSKVIENKKLIFYDLSINSFKSKVIPCYFPVGRGNPKKSVEILKLLHSILQ